MKNLLLALTLSTVSLAIANAQTTPQPPDATTALRTIFGTSLPAGTPTQFVGLGAGYKNSAASGWVNGGVSVSPGTFATIATDTQQGNTATRAGLHQVVYAHPSGAFFLSILAEAGVATGTSTVGGTYAGGPSLAIRLGANSPRYIALTAVAQKADVSTYAAAPTGPGQLRKLAGGMTWRVGLLGKVK